MERRIEIGRKFKPFTSRRDPPILSSKSSRLEGKVINFWPFTRTVEIVTRSDNQRKVSKIYDDHTPNEQMVASAGRPSSWCLLGLWRIRPVTVTLYHFGCKS